MSNLPGTIHDLRDGDLDDDPTKSAATSAVRTQSNAASVTVIGRSSSTVGQVRILSGVYNT